MTDILVIAIVVIVIGLAVGYVVKEKKRGAKCIGCPNSKTCQGGCSHCGK